MASREATVRVTHIGRGAFRPLIEFAEKEQAREELAAIEIASLEIEPIKTMDALTAWATKHSIALPLTDLGRYPIFMILARAKDAI